MSSKKLYFRYGSMNSSKSANLLMVAYNYKEKGYKTLILQSSINNRDGEGFVKSRALDEKQQAIIVEEDTDIFELVAYKKKEHGKLLACILVDESQFLLKHHIEQLCDVVDILGLPVICYGLRADFKGELFEGSKYLLAWADEIEEIPNICHYCKKKARFNMRLIKGKPTFEGKQIVVGDEQYVSVCRNCFNKAKHKIPLKRK